MSSRSLDDLCLQTRAKVDSWLAECKRQGLDILVTSTYRSFAEQDAIFAQGRTRPGPVVTKARGGQSYHNVRRAVDFVPLTGGKPNWSGSNPDLLTAATLGEHHGLKWGGHWHHPDNLHLEDEWCEVHQIGAGPSNPEHFREDGTCRILPASQPQHKG